MEARLRQESERLFRCMVNSAVEVPELQVARFFDMTGPMILKELCGCDTA